MKILVLNGPNLNMLGIREPSVYGNSDYNALKKFIKTSAKKEGVRVTIKQSNYEGKLVTLIQKAYKKFDGIVINPGAYTHTSVAILDALKAVNIPAIEVHLTDVNSREDFRKVSYIRLACLDTVKGEGFDGYKKALTILKDNLNK